MSGCDRSSSQNGRPNLQLTWVRFPRTVHAHISWDFPNNVIVLLLLLVEFFGRLPFGLLEAFTESSTTAYSGRALASMSATSSRALGACFATIEDVIASEHVIGLNSLSL